MKMLQRLMAMVAAWLVTTNILAVAISPRMGEGIVNVASVAERGAGLCIVLGGTEEIATQLAQNPKLLLHCLDKQDEQVAKLRLKLDGSRASAFVESWNHQQLPHADNLANYVIVNDTGLTQESEIERVLCPGGVAIWLSPQKHSPFIKPIPSDTDEWTHQWHSADGGLVTEDLQVGVPQGVQWLAGPLFAMAGRKSSTQSLVSANGINFYLTQNVLENVGVTEMQQYLVARDAYNGLVLWQRPWVGPYVTGDGETNARMVTSGDTVYVAGDKQLLAIDARTGRTTAEQSMDTSAEKLLFHQNVVLVQNSLGVMAYDSSLASRLWVYETEQASGLVAWEQGAYCLIRSRSPDGQFNHDLVRLDIATGKEVFRASTQPHVLSVSVQINFAQDGLIALHPHGHLHLFSAEDGRHLWSRATEAVPGKDYVDERYVGHFYLHDLVWMLEQNSPRTPEGQNRWVGLDPKTGAVQRELTTHGDWPATATPAKMGCQLLIASDRYIMIPRQATYIDIETGEKIPFKFVRGGCGLGFVPANGLVYSHPHACGCFSEAIRGFIGMHSQPTDQLAGVSGERLMVSSGVTKLEFPRSSPSDWEMYRGDSGRSGHVAANVGGDIKPAWSRKLAKLDDSMTNQAWRLRTGNLLTAPTIVAGKAFVADVDQGRLFCIDLESGKTAWDFQANGRIDSPPTVYRGICVFGAHDGYVYGVEASRGKLAWKFRAAPKDRRIIAFGQLESTWPVAGSVLIHDGVAYAAAGRSQDADGGVEVHALDPLTGASKWSAAVEGGELRSLCDYLIADDQYVYLANWQFDQQTGTNGPAPLDSPHLQGGKVGLLEASWTKHDLANRKDIQTWAARGIAGQLICFSDTTTAAYDAASRTIAVKSTADGFEHTLGEPEQVTAMLLTKSHLIIAGGVNRADCLAGGFLRSIELGNPRQVKNLVLPAEAALDAMAIGRGWLVISTQDGQVHCYKAE